MRVKRRIKDLENMQFDQKTNMLKVVGKEDVVVKNINAIF
jgi:hypothetical protein